MKPVISSLLCLFLCLPNLSWAQSFPDMDICQYRYFEQSNIEHLIPEGMTYDGLKDEQGVAYFSFWIDGEKPNYHLKVILKKANDEIEEWPIRVFVRYKPAPTIFTQDTAICRGESYTFPKAKTNRFTTQVSWTSNETSMRYVEGDQCLIDQNQLFFNVRYDDSVCNTVSNHSFQIYGQNKASETSLQYHSIQYKLCPGTLVDLPALFRSNVQHLQFNELSFTDQQGQEVSSPITVPPMGQSINISANVKANGTLNNACGSGVINSNDMHSVNYTVTGGDCKPHVFWWSPFTNYEIGKISTEGTGTTVYFRVLNVQTPYFDYDASDIEVKTNHGEYLKPYEVLSDLDMVDDFHYKYIVKLQDTIFIRIQATQKPSNQSIELYDTLYISNYTAREVLTFCRDQFIKEQISLPMFVSERMRFTALVLDPFYDTYFEVKITQNGQGIEISSVDKGNLLGMPQSLPMTIEYEFDGSKYMHHANFLLYEDTCKPFVAYYGGCIGDTVEIFIQEPNYLHTTIKTYDIQIRPEEAVILGEKEMHTNMYSRYTPMLIVPLKNFVVIHYQWTYTYDGQLTEIRDSNMFAYNDCQPIIKQLDEKCRGQNTRISLKTQHHSIEHVSTRFEAEDPITVDFIGLDPDQEKTYLFDIRSNKTQDITCITELKPHDVNQKLTYTQQVNLAVWPCTPIVTLEQPKFCQGDSVFFEIQSSNPEETITQVKFDLSVMDQIPLLVKDFRREGLHIQSFVIINSTSSVIKAEVTRGANGTTFVDDVQSTFVWEPMPTIFTIDSLKICMGEIRDLSGFIQASSSLSDMVLWTHAPMTVVPLPTQDTIQYYEAEAMMNIRCRQLKDNIYRDTIVVVNQSLPQLTINYSLDPTAINKICTYPTEPFFFEVEGAHTYIWMDNDAYNQARLDVNTPPTAPSYYFVVGTATNGCQSRDTFVMAEAEPDLSFPSDWFVCSGDTLVYASTPGVGMTISWIFPDGSELSTHTLTLNDIQPEDQGLYIQRRLQHRCTLNQEARLNVHHIPEPTLSPIAASYCEGDYFEVIATGGPQFQWRSEQGYSSQADRIVYHTLRLSDSGHYEVFAFDDQCQSTALGFDLKVFDIPQSTLPADTFFCEGRPLQLDASVSGCTYLWSTGSTDASIWIDKPGSLWLRLSRHGCEREHTIEVSQMPVPVFSLGSDTTICYGDALVLDYSAMDAVALWQDGATELLRNLTEAGIYQLTLSYSHCAFSDTMVLETRFCGQWHIPTGFMPKSEIEENRIFRPFIKIDQSMLTYQLSIFDRMGRCVFQSDHVEEGWDGTFKGKDLPAGIYVFVIKANEHQFGTDLSAKGVLNLIR